MPKQQTWLSCLRIAAYKEQKQKRQQRGATCDQALDSAAQLRPASVKIGKGPRQHLVSKMMLATVETVRASAGPPDADLNSSPMPYTVQRPHSSSRAIDKPCTLCWQEYTFAYTPDVYATGRSGLCIPPAGSKS